MKRASFWSRHRILKWFALSCLALLIGLTIAAAIAVRHVEPVLHALIIEKLQQHFHARVELDSFHVSIAEGLRAEGKGLRIWPPAQVATGARANQPLIEIAEFRFRAPLHFTRGKPIRISRIELRGLTIDIPPEAHWMNLHRSASTSDSTPPSPPTVSALPQASSAPGPAGSTEANLLQFRVDSVLCDGATLTLEKKDPAKLPLVFQIKTVRVTHISPGGAMDFDATLTNPKPRGTIATKGSFGPWDVDAPGMTPLNGNYTFDHANLGDFRGISGTLNSTGRYQGALVSMTVDGVTDTPDFALSSFGTPLPLKTTFHATVDATNGDTWLEPVDATLGETQFEARGKVVDEAAVTAANGAAVRPAGHEIALTVNIDHGQIADFLRLTSHHGNPLLTGTLHMRAVLDIPPGKSPVHQRMRLNGKFLLDDAHFTSQKIQDRIGDLSMRGQGKPKEAKSDQAGDTLSTMSSDFTMANAVIALPNLIYAVPGAVIQLKGNYDIEGGALDFNGDARMQATVSQMVGGWKGVLLSPLDRLFKKDGAGTKVKVRVGGTRQDPHFGVDF